MCVCFTLFALIIRVFIEFYTSVYRKRSLSLRFIDNFYCFFHGFWYTGLMIAQNWPKLVTCVLSCVVHDGTFLDPLLRNNSGLFNRL